MVDILTQYVTILFEFFKYDIGVYSNPWMYIPLLIPVLFYTIFFFIKWTILTAPIWLPFSIIFKSVASIFKRDK